MLGTVFPLGVLVPMGIGIWRLCSPDTVWRSARVGTFESAAISTGGFFSPDISIVRTTAGSISVFGHFSTLNGSPLVLRDTSKAGPKLCVVDTPAPCARVAGAWSGPWVGSPTPLGTFNFERYGLTTGLLTVWGILGVLLALALLILLGSNYAREQDEARGSKGSAPK